MIEPIKCETRNFHSPRDCKEPCHLGKELCCQFCLEIATCIKCCPDFPDVIRPLLAEQEKEYQKECQAELALIKPLAIPKFEGEELKDSRKTPHPTQQQIP